MPRGGKVAAPLATPPVSGVPCTVHPDLRTPAEMHALWREWGWRVLGEEPVADTDRAAFADVCRVLQANWGSVYRPVALLPPRRRLLGAEEVRLYNRCLGISVGLRRHGVPITPAALAAAANADEHRVERLLTRILHTLEATHGAGAPAIQTITATGEHR